MFRSPAIFVASVVIGFGQFLNLAVWAGWVWMIHLSLATGVPLGVFSRIAYHRYADGFFGTYRNLVGNVSMPFCGTPMPIRVQLALNALRQSF